MHSEDEMALHMTTAGTAERNTEMLFEVYQILRLISSKIKKEAYNYVTPWVFVKGDSLLRKVLEHYTQKEIVVSGTTSTLVHYPIMRPVATMTSTPGGICRLDTTATQREHAIINTIAALHMRACVHDAAAANGGIIPTLIGTSFSIFFSRESCTTESTVTASGALVSSPQLGVEDEPVHTSTAMDLDDFTDVAQQDETTTSTAAVTDNLAFEDEDFPSYEGDDIFQGSSSTFLALDVLRQINLSDHVTDAELFTQDRDAALTRIADLTELSLPLLQEQRLLYRSLPTQKNRAAAASQRRLDEIANVFASKGYFVNQRDRPRIHMTEQAPETASSDISSTLRIVPGKSTENTTVVIPESPPHSIPSSPSSSLSSSSSSYSSGSEYVP